MDDTLVVINYFAGWWEQRPNKWQKRDGSDWRGEYSQRVPLLGEFNSQETMDKEITAAADHGVDAFVILWYYNDPGSQREPHSRLLNRGVPYFMNSPQSGRMKFFVEFCNHPPFEVQNDEQWDDCINSWVEMMKHPSYLRVGGKIVFKVHGAQFFYDQNGKDLERCVQLLEQLRGKVRAAGLGEMLIAGGVSGGGVDEDHFASKIFDFTMTYMDVPPLEQREDGYSYDLLAEFAEKIRADHKNDVIPYVPYVPAGWDPRPWGDRRAFFAQPDREQLVRVFRKVKSDIDACERFGVPLPDGGRQKMFTIYAWNEFGEGGFMAPTKGSGYMKIEAIREVFGVGK